MTYFQNIENECCNTLNRDIFEIDASIRRCRNSIFAHFLAF